VTPSGVWLGATYVLGRTVRVGELYPHICGQHITGRMTPSLRVSLWKRDCGACAWETAERQTAARAELAELQAEHRRRAGERDDEPTDTWGT
jgi:hypothetical protein